VIDCNNDITVHINTENGKNTTINPYPLQKLILISFKTKIKFSESGGHLDF